MIIVFLELYFFVGSRPDCHLTKSLVDLVTVNPTLIAGAGITIELCVCVCMSPYGIAHSPPTQTTHDAVTIR